MIRIDEQTDPRRIVETNFDPSTLAVQETIFTIGNGYLGTRGTYEEGYSEAQPATLVHGVFDDAPVVHTELANTPDWTSLEILLDGERFSMEQGKLLRYRRSLDLQHAVLSREVLWESPGGKQTRLEFERFASLAAEHILAVKLRVTPLNWSGEVELRGGLMGFAHNESLLHWRLVDQGRLGPQSAFLSLQTVASKIDLCEAFYFNMALEGGVDPGPLDGIAYWDSRGIPTLVSRRYVTKNQTASAVKLVAVYTSRDGEDPLRAASTALPDAAQAGYGALLSAHREAWHQEWERCDIRIEGDVEADLSLRYSIFQLLIAAPRHDDRVSIPAKSLSGFGYRGHVFWDTDIFLLPFFTYTSPHLARNLLLYRYHTLPGARRKAREDGWKGAMFAWESAATGDESTPRWVIGPDGKKMVRIWPGDIEIHISADVSYAVMQYWQVTGDDAFMRDYGAEIVLDTAQFWGSRAEWNEEHRRYELSNVIGPDEYHDHIDNNAYTNALARWNLQAALQVLDWLETGHPDKARELVITLSLSAEDRAHWRDVIEKMYLGFDPKSGLYEQFEGYFKLQPVNQEDYEPRKLSFQALFGIEASQKNQIIKQPDVLMMAHLLPGLLSEEQLKTNWEYYTPRTDLALGSSLGPAIQALLAARLGDPETAHRHFIHAARTDLQDVRDNTRDGIHAATHGGLWQAAVFGFGGLAITPHGPRVRPALPGHWTRLSFKIRYRGRAFQFDLRPGSGQASAAQEAEGGPAPSLPVRGVIFDLDGVLADTSEFHYQGWQRLADEEGLPFDRQANERLRGVDRRESLLRLLDGRTYPEEKLLELMERKNRYYLESIMKIDSSNLLPGVRDFLEQLHRAGIPMAIASASKNARPVIEKLGLGELVAAIADGNSVERQKPAPDLFLHAASLLGLSPGNCLVFEDAHAGVDAALAAGMWVVGLGPQERVGHAHLRYPSLDGLRWDGITQALEEVQNRFTGVRGE